MKIQIEQMLEEKKVVNLNGQKVILLSVNKLDETVAYN
jgi:hypothetical protein